MNLEHKTVRLRLVEPDDAEFILRLRLDDRYNKYLSKVSGGLVEQRMWIENYKKDEAAKLQFYFIIERLDGTPCGTVRIYDLRENSFCWGSWILNDDKTKYAAIESAFLVYRYGFGVLGFEKSHFDVMKGNAGVIKFHERMGATVTGEDELNYFFEISRSSVTAAEAELSEKI
ncbi:GNAT family N-acetyltransferase [Halopseudomonas sp.]|uniref:GNAT family N-acetyltransferase n=1 Tax=Halopseudomonas sp. TaxID=2901191 RepID=UPI0030024EAC